MRVAQSCKGVRTVSILIPVYNERETIEQVMMQVAAAPLPPGVEREIIVVDDGSRDGTSQVLARYQRQKPFRIVFSQTNSGKGTALRQAIACARGDILIIQDADLEYNPEDFAQLLGPLLTGEAKAVYGTRFAQGRPAGMGRAQWLANRILCWAANLLYGGCISDEATAYKAFDAQFLQSLSLTCRRFEFCPEVTAKILKQGIPIREVPVRYRSRTAAQGKKIRWHDGLQALWVLMKYRLVN
ncbi:MAG: glycosyltransferase family 2 protein [Acidobacteria bacterium]|nr:glycosyltransferase family 2 protein [Acidobacteriota bacterium]